MGCGSISFEGIPDFPMERVHNNFDHLFCSPGLCFYSIVTSLFFLLLRKNLRHLCGRALALF